MVGFASVCIQVLAAGVPVPGCGFHHQDTSQGTLYFLRSSPQLTKVSGPQFPTMPGIAQSYFEHNSSATATAMRAWFQHKFPDRFIVFLDFFQWVGTGLAGVSGSFGVVVPGVIF